MAEGDIRTQRQERIACEVCGEPATKCHTYLLPRARVNPESAAYGKGDCSWCEDETVFTCEEHASPTPDKDGYEWCSTFGYDRFPHMFLKWVTVED